MTVPFNQVISNPGLKDVLDLLKKNIFLSLNCHAIATVQSVDTEFQTLTAVMNYCKTYFRPNSKGQFIANPVDYPALTDIPFIILGGGNATLTFPIAAGDQCLIIFNDRDMDNWYSGATSGAVNSNRLHSFSDGIALVGLRNLATSLDDYDASRAVLQNGTSKIAIGTKINIQNGSESLYTILNTLLGAIAAAVSSTGDTGIATIAAAATAAQSSIGNLLD